MTDTREVLLKAADIIEKSSLWKPGRKGGDCAYSAISRVASLDDKMPVAALKNYLGLSPNDGAGPIYVWNDDPKRTKKEVVAALRGAAESLAVPA